MDAPISALREVAHRFRTPTYAYDLGRIRAQMQRLRTEMPASVDWLYSLKANASLGLCRFIAEHGFGADVASAGELVTALAAEFPTDRIFLTGPDRSPAVLEKLGELPEAVVSLDSVSELELLARQGFRHQMILRLRPDFCSHATCPAGPDSRFGVPFEELLRCRDVLRQHSPRLVGFHVFSGSQVLDAAAVIHHLRGGVELSLRAADALGVAPEMIDIGGGFGVAYGPEDKELDLAPISEELAMLCERVAPARLVIELGRFFVAEAGWYLTTVIARQTHCGRPAVVVDGGSHQRGDLCGIGLRRRAFPPLVLRASEEDCARHDLEPTDVLGCLSLPSDVLLESGLLLQPRPGDVLAFPNAGAYGFAASPLLFHAHPAPAEVAFEDMHLMVLRERASLDTVLERQSFLYSAAPTDRRAEGGRGFSSRTNGGASPRGPRKFPEP